MIIKSIKINFTDKDKTTLDDLDVFCKQKGNFKYTQGILEILALGIKCYKTGFRLLDDKLVKIQEE